MAGTPRSTGATSKWRAGGFTRPTLDVLLFGNAQLFAAQGLHAAIA
jgi:hypothetical protein